MEHLSLHQRLQTVEQKLIDVAQQIEALREKLPQAMTPESDDSEALSGLPLALQKYAAQLREIGQAINLKTTLLKSPRGGAENGAKVSSAVKPGHR